MTAAYQSTENRLDRHAFDFARACELAVESVRKTCRLQLDRDYVPTHGFPDPEGPVSLSSITLSNDDVALILAITTDKNSSESLTRHLFEMAYDEEVSNEDMADALKELVNISAGIFKSRLAELGDLQLGLPLFSADDGRLENDKFGVGGEGSLVLHDDGTSIRIHLIQQERNES